MGAQAGFAASLAAGTSTPRRAATSKEWPPGSQSVPAWQRGRAGKAGDGACLQPIAAAGSALTRYRRPVMSGPRDSVGGCLKSHHPPRTVPPRTVSPRTAPPSRPGRRQEAADGLALTVSALSESELLARISPPGHGRPHMQPRCSARGTTPPSWPPRTAGRSSASTPRCRTRTSGCNGPTATGPPASTSAGKPPRRTSATSTPWAPAPRRMVVSLTLPPETPVGWVEDLADGLTAGIRELGAADCSVAGGDLGRGPRNLRHGCRAGHARTAARPCCGPVPARGRPGPGRNGGPRRRRPCPAGVGRCTLTP